MFGGGGGLNPRKMQQMMEQMGIEMDELDTEEVVIRLEDGTELVFDDADVTKMEARGQETYQIVGDPESRTGGASDAESRTDEGSDAEQSEESSEGEIPDEDVELVAERTGATADDAREALESEDGDLAAAISRLE